MLHKTLFRPFSATMTRAGTQWEQHLGAGDDNMGVGLWEDMVKVTG